MSDKKTDRPPRAGTFMEWLTRHAHLDYDEMTTAANRAGFKVSRRGITKRMHLARAHYPELVKQSKTKSKQSPKTKSKPRPKQRPTAADLKASQLRRLIFEMGYDGAREIFAEFQHMHERMNGGG